MRFRYQQLSVVYAHSTDDELVLIGSANFSEPNSLKVTLNDQALRGDLRRFAFASCVTDEVSIPADALARPIRGALWGRPKGRKPERRPKTWELRPLDDNLVLMIPQVEALSLYDMDHDGFIERYPKDTAAPIHAPWVEQVQWIRDHLNAGVSESTIADQLHLPLSSIEGAKTWTPPRTKKKAPPSL